jgi:hypothetical protein
MIPAPLTSSNCTWRPLVAMIIKVFAVARSVLMLSSRGRNRAGVTGFGLMRFLTVISTSSASAARTEMRPTSSGQKFTRADPRTTRTWVTS